MDANLPRSRFGLDLLIAEAKRRMHRRRVLLGVAAVAAAAAAVLAVQPSGGGRALGVAANDTAIAQIPGMTRVAADGVAPWLRIGCTAPQPPPTQRRPDGCRGMRVRAGRFEAWRSTSGGSDSQNMGPLSNGLDRLRQAEESGSAGPAARRSSASP
jgi:hypothetical protein